MVRRALVLTLLTLAVPSAAQAATVTLSGGVLRYAATAGEVSNVLFTESGGTLTVTRATGDTDPFTLSGCGGTTDSATCTGVTRIEVDAGDGSDRVTATSGDPLVGIPIPMVISGGSGNDVLTAGGRSDTLDGGDGDDDLDGSSGNDVLRGGEGNDILTPNTGTDGVSGGEGVDTVTYNRRVALSLSLDGLANDGEAGENDLIGTDVENVEGSTSSGTVTIVGDGRPNQFRVLGGIGVITGGEGSDVLAGGPADDVINARDSSPDTVTCAGGIDTVQADTLDVVSPSCENVSTQASPGGPFDDKPPVLAWSAPGASASLSANDPTVLRVDATDDRGLAKVQFLDDERVVCEITAAPYECAYQPRGGDVGRNTLIAIAFDGAGQTTSVVRPVTVRRFTSAGLSLSFKPSRDRKAPYSFRATGTLRRPATVSPTQGCSGRVVITAKRGSKTVGTTRTSLGRTCEYAVTVRFRSKVGSRIRLTAKFEGNDVISSRSAPRRTVRLG
ncbi:Ig-like domain-containing protein [Solirubrobacter phytolaccae]|uniref:Ig-like domain-containing protein n=1 Tax=Solirubrobacter phytolaccae TaxID=1404360 RepID=A0A9X3NGJ1_9ACTN|nr:Ig-like domain-containing protein [Solirubrobacter phytolaccae]MDA0184560.1 Ig-like domain-containing protein [Solirubrobacter phytolaccae]